MAAIPTADITYLKIVPLKGKLQLVVAELANTANTDRHLPAAVSRLDHVVWAGLFGHTGLTNYVILACNAQATGADLSYADANYSGGDIAFRSSSGTFNGRLMAIGLKRG